MLIDSLSTTTLKMDNVV